MGISNNGNVVVVDDNIYEALPLLQALARKSVPAIYYDGKLRNFSDTPMVGIRVVFLDMKIAQIAHKEDVSSILLSILSKVLDANNGPYVLIIWSKHNNIYLEDFKQKLFSYDKIPKPIDILDMNKTDFFTSVDIQENDFVDEICSTLEDNKVKLSGNTISELKSKIHDSRNPLIRYKLKDDGIEKIEEKLYEELQKVGIFNILLLWENEIKKSSSNTVNQFSSIEPIDENWSKNMKLLFNKMAIANIGKDNIKNSIDIIKSSFSTFISILFDNINLSLTSNNDLEKNMEENDENVGILMERNDNSSNCNFLLTEDDKNYIINKKNNNDTPIRLKKSKYPFKIENDDNEDKHFAIDMANNYVEYISKINSKILLCIDNNKLKQPGNVYSIASKKDEKKSLIDDCFNRIEDDSNNTILNEIQYVELEISPECDCAQNKWTLNRILPGLLIPSNYFNFIKKADYIYETPFLFIDDDVRKFIFDYKYFTACKLDYLDNKELLLRFSKTLLMQIKNRVGFHIIRSGITNL